MRLAKQFCGDLLPDIDPTINVARAKQWDEACQMAARQLFLGRSASEAIVTAHAERITLVTALLKQIAALTRAYRRADRYLAALPGGKAARSVLRPDSADEREREHVNVGRNGGRHDVGRNGHFAGLG